MYEIIHEETLMTTKIYELTTNGKDGYAKWYVKGIKNHSEARKVAKNAFGKFYWTGGISYYDDYLSKYGNDWKSTPNKVRFIKKVHGYYHGKGGIKGVL
jgi:hypothetical protein